jgi:hypothetical protein
MSFLNLDLDLHEDKIIEPSMMTRLQNSLVNIWIGSLGSNVYTTFLYR